jgi:hypothetical protein
MPNLITSKNPRLPRYEKKTLKHQNPVNFMSTPHLNVSYEKLVISHPNTEPTIPTFLLSAHLSDHPFTHAPTLHTLNKNANAKVEYFLSQTNGK